MEIKLLQLSEPNIIKGQVESSEGFYFDIKRRRRSGKVRNDKI